MVVVPDRATGRRNGELVWDGDATPDRFPLVRTDEALRMARERTDLATIHVSVVLMAA